MLATILQSITAFVVTNLDDLLVLMLFFAQGQYRSTIIGQYVGFTLLILLSLPGYLGGAVVSPAWVGLLGILPLGMGIKQLATADQDNDSESSVPVWLAWIYAVFPAAIAKVAALTVANGGDNIGIYVPLFASKNLSGLLVTLGIFGLLVGIWCLVALWLVRQPLVAVVLTRYGAKLVPWVLIALGLDILYESGSFVYFWSLLKHPE